MSIADKLTQIAENEKKVYDAGKKAEYNEFWDDYSADGGMQNRFSGTGWTKNTFRPKKDFFISEGTFLRHGWGRTPTYDLAEHFENLGVRITGIDYGVQSFMTCTIFTRLPLLDGSMCRYWDRTFNGMTNLETIDKLIINTDNGCTWFGDNLFGSCSKLKNLIVEGTVGKTINFSPCPLSVASIKSIISCLKDYSGTGNEYTYTVTFKASAFNELEQEGATAEYNGTACTWAELIDNKKWNLVKA